MIAANGVENSEKRMLKMKKIIHELQLFIFIIIAYFDYNC